MAGEIKITAKRHPVYQANAGLWSFYGQSFKGGQPYINANLFSHRLEHSTDFSNRQMRAHFLNYCRPLPHIYTDYLYRESPRRPGNFHPEVLQNIDGRGRMIDELIANCSTLSAVYGQIHVLIDKPNVENPTGSLATASLPYATIYLPENVLDWSVDYKGELNWVLLREPVYEDLDPMTARKSIDQYRLLTREGWKVIIKDEKGEERITAQGDWALGVVPLVTCYHQDIDQDMIGESMLTDIAPINRVVFNWTSCIDEQVERQTFSQLVMPDSGEGGGSNAEPVKMATSAIFTYPADAKHAPSFISPDTSQIQTIWTMVEKHIGEIYRLALLAKGNDALLGAQSGVSKAYDFVDTNQALASKASQMQKFENELLKVIGLWFGQKELSEGDNVVYGREFDVIALEHEIKNTFDLVSQGISETFNKLLYKKVVRKALKSATANEFHVIDDEIDSGSTIAATDIDIEHDDNEHIHGAEAEMNEDGEAREETKGEAL